MTPLETLQKYELKTDVKSIRERLSYVYSYKSIIREYLTTGKSITNEQFYSQIYKLEDELRFADLSLLCSLAEKGERLVELIKTEIKNATYIPRCRHYNEILTKITEAEGEGK